MSVRPTIGAVAKAAGVAPSTVSRALNGGYVSAELKAHIDTVIERLAYRPWSTARNFKLGRSGSIGLVVENTAGAWFTQLLLGVEAGLRPARLSLQLGSLDLDGTYDSQVVSTWIRERRVDGLIFVRPRARERALIEAARRAALPVSLIAPDEDHEGCAIVRSDNRGAGAAVARHLLALGHRRLAFVGGPKVSLDTRERLAGVRSALQAIGMKLEAEQLHFAAEYTAAKGAEFAGRWLARRKTQSSTAIVFGNDSLALGFLRVVQANGVLVPREISVAGFDDIPEAGLHWPGLTTMRQELRALGATACAWLLAPAGSNRTRSARALELATTLVIRESTSRPRKR
jgi:DNA-binding LacI/PurR family transcriptional regulator